MSKPAAHRARLNSPRYNGPRRNAALRRLTLATLLPALLIAATPPTATRAHDGPEGHDAAYGGCYTPEELAALDRALWVVNATRADLSFKKDYGKGYECFPIVREMMADPLKIGEAMQRLDNEIAPPSDGASWLASVMKQSMLITNSAAPQVPKVAQSDSLPKLDIYAGIYQASPQGVNLSYDPATNDLIAACWSLLNCYPSLPEAAKSAAFREWLPTAMAWHTVDTADTKDASDEEAAPSKDNFAATSEIDLNGFYRAFGVDIHFELDDGIRLGEISMLISPEDKQGAFPDKTPIIVDTDIGRICLGTLHDDTYTGDFAVLIDPGGNDHYVNCRIGAAYGKKSSGSAGVTPASSDGGGSVRPSPSGAAVPGGHPDAPRDGRATADASGTLALPDEDADKTSALQEDYSPLGDGRVGFFCDLGGDDFYDCADVDITLGAAVLGVAAFYDLGAGDDRYYGGNFSLGAAAGGIATFYDDGGSDYYSGKVYTQGAAGFGIAIMCDDSVQPAPVVPTDVETPDPIDVGAFDNDVYTAWSEAQGFARTRGVAICANKRGNELYHAGGVYLDAPLFSDRYCSFSQGFAIGERDIDYAGGIALLADYSGNDRYLGDVYNQGVGYWYSAGFLYDGGGNDLYEMTQYGQGSGIHLAVGGLIDEAGSDTYIMHNGLGQGGSHDFAASLLLDKAGNDRYLGNTSCNGCGLTNAVGLFFDRAGDDVYAARDDSGINFGRPARGFGSLGVFVDLGGADSYLGKMDDAQLWQRTTYGVGLDYDPAKMAALIPADPGSASVPLASAPGDGFDKPSADVKMPSEVHYEGALTQEIFDKLWEIAIRWEVGDNRAIVPEARKRLIAFGPDVLPYIEKKMDDPNSLAVRGYVDVFKAFAYVPVEPVGAGLVPPSDSTSAPKGGASPAPTAPLTPPEPEPAESMPLIEALLARQLQTSEEPRRMAALSVITELKLKGVAPALTTLLDDPELGMRRRAIAALGAVGSEAANDRLIALLGGDADEALTKVSIETLCTLKADCYGKLRLLLGSPSFTVRDVLENQLVAQWERYGADVRADYLLAFGAGDAAAGGFDLRSKRALLRLLLRAPGKPDAAMIKALSAGLGSTDWGLRADSVELVRYWSAQCADDPALDVLFSGETGLLRDLSSLAETTPDPQPLRLPEK